MAQRIDTVDSRAKLKARRSPYWHRLSSGCHVGYRKLNSSAPGTWISQAYDPATRKQIRRSLGSYDQLPAHQRFDAAKRDTEEWFGRLGRSIESTIWTVLRACQEYVKHLRELQREKSADDVDARFERWVYKDPIAGFELPKLTRRHVDGWRGRVTSKAVIVNPYAKAAEQKTRKRSPSTINRDMTALRAALNYAHDCEQVNTDAAWRVALRPIENADGRRNAYLDRADRANLLSHAESDVADFLRGLALVPLRPGALAALNCAMFDPKLSVQTIGKDKSGKDRKIRLPRRTAQFFASLCEGQEPETPIFRRANGGRWTKDAWKKPVKAAALAAGLGEEITAYALRHSAITDLITGGLDLLTVAQLSGTSVTMIERHYGHLRAQHATAALAGLSL